MKVAQRAVKWVIIITIIVITLKDFSIKINPDAMPTIKIEKLQFDFTNLEYFDIEIKKFIWVLENTKIIHKL